MGPNIIHFLFHYIDTDENTLINRNEFRTLLANTGIHHVDVFQNCTFESMRNNTNNNFLKVNPSSFTTIKMREIYECSFITSRLIATKNWDSLGVKYSIGNSDDISFEMISENTTNTLIQLDSVRSRQNKFICINDNIESDKSNHID